MKLTKIALFAAVNAQSGDEDYQQQEQADVPLLEHRSLFGNSPFAALFAAPSKPKKNKAKSEAIVESKQDEYEYDADEDLEDYEGDLEGFDIEEYRDSDAVNKVLNQALFQQSNFQRGQGSFGGINGGPNAPGVAQSTANRVEVLMKMIMYLQAWVFFISTLSKIFLVIRASISSFSMVATASQMVKNLFWAVMVKLVMAQTR